MKPLALLLTMLSVALLACGGGDGDGGPGAQDRGPSGQAPQTTTVDACALVTRAEAEALLGSAVADTQKGPVGPFQSCGYYSSAGVFDFVQVQACRCLGGNQFDASARAGGEALGVTVKPVAGVGDKAYWLNGILWVQKGPYAVNLWISTAALTREGGQALQGEALERKALPKHIEVAQRVLARLP
ncbi:MAG TPA: hypothetical protein VNN10_09030 [Dehalococcoidia bacterium]|nr:hypothetical protein [Dehalococcoidia bacterium]